jgi:hypothetical protein
MFTARISEENSVLKNKVERLTSENNVLKGSNVTFTFPVPVPVAAV